MGKGKVLALPFDLDPSSARAFAKGAAVRRSQDKRLPIVLVTTILGVLAKRVFGVSRWVDAMESASRMERFEALYLPYWIVDASVKLQAQGSDVSRPAQASFGLPQARMPGFDWHPLRSLPLWVPGLDSHVEYQVFDESLLKGPAMTYAKSEEGADYAVQKPRSDTDQDWAESRLPLNATLLPFTNSPLSLPALFKNCPAALRTVEVPVDLPIEGSMAEIEKDREAFAVKQLQEHQEQDDDSPSSRIRFKSETLDVDMLAAYPVLLPVYLFRFKARLGKDGQQLPPLTMVLSGWKHESEYA